MAQQKKLFRYVGKTRIVSITLKIVTVVTIFLLLSNFATNYINLVMNQKEIVNLTNDLMVKELKEIYTFASTQYDIFQFSQDRQEALDAITEKATKLMKTETSRTIGISPRGEFVFQAGGSAPFEQFPDADALQEIFARREKDNTTEGVIFFTTDEGEHIGAYKYMDKWDAYIIRADSMKQMMSSSNKIFIRIGIIIFILVILFLGLTAYSVSYMLRFVRKISDQMLDMQNKQEMEILKLDGAPNDEISYLGTSFNALSSTINNLMNIFRKFVTKDVVTKAYQEQEIRLEGRQMELTILFSDIRGFTYMTETLGNDIINLLNVHYNRAIKHIHEKHGIVGSIIGDALLAVYGTLPQKGNKSLNALYSAYEIHEVVKELRNEMKEKRIQIEAENGPLSEKEEEIYKAVLIDVGVGIDGGNVFYGNIGSFERMTNTVIGDNVNSSSRLEGLTRIYQTPIICSSYVVDEITKETDQFIFIELDTVQVKGKTEGKKIFVPVDTKAPNAEEEIENYKIYSKALQAYYDGDWSLARKEFTKCNINCKNVFLDRIKKSKAPEDWRGIWTMSTK